MTVTNLPSETRIAARQYTKERDYWLGKLSGEWEKSSFSCDYIKETGGINREKFPFAVQEEVFEKLMKLSNGADDLLHMALSAALALLLNKYTGNSDIVLGTPIYKQSIQKEFINRVLVIRNRLENHMTFKDLLVQVRQTINEAVEHLNYPVEILAEQLNLPESPGEFPLFDVVILLGNIHDESYISHIHPNMIFSFSGTSESMSGVLDYNASLYREDTAARIAAHFNRLLDRAMSGMDVPLSRIEVLSAEEKEELLITFNDTQTPYPKHKTIPQLFEEQVEKAPHHIALIFENQSITYKELDEKANRLANYLYHENRVRPDDPVALLLERSPLLITAIMGILKAGGAYVPIDTSFPEERVKNMIDDANIGVFVSQKKFIKTLNRLQWECSSLHTVICLDSEDILSEEEEEKSELMSRKLWEYVGETASDDITGGGWLSSYTGEPIPDEEMAEYGDNVLKKLLPLLHEDMRVLEIGCASGLSMYRIAPRVALYYGTDLSSVIIRKNEERVKEEGINNIKLYCLPADEIDRIPEKDFDLIIINSVIQCFHGHNYLRKVLAEAVTKIKDKGWVFIGDVMNMDLQEELIKDLEMFKQTARDQGKTHYKTKLDWSAELFISPSFFKDLLFDIPGICRVEFSDKIYTIENELTKFRYDALFTIDKSDQSRTREKRSGSRHKYQHDLRALRKYDPEPLSPGLKPADLAYIIYTSGSTGTPKGTLTNHFNVIRVVRDTNYIELTGSDNVLQLSNYAFDGSVFDIYGALLNGSKLVMINEQEVFAADKLTALIRRENITVFLVTTALFNVLVDIDIECLKNVRNVLFGGEQVSLEHSRKALNYLGKNRVIHLYGPTEATVYATYYYINEIEEGQVTVPIGKAIANTTLYVLDKESRPVPIGVPGELVIGGDGVARGYLNRPELTAEKFPAARGAVEGPTGHLGAAHHLKNLPEQKFCSNFFKSLAPGRAHHVVRGLDIHENQLPVPLEGARAACYKTGDLVRWLPGGPPAGGPSKATFGGNIEFLGRIDKQVKIRGFRIELGEIEHRLSKHPDIKETAVLAREGAGGENYLCAYIVPRSNTHSETSQALSISELSEYLSRELPDFMVPAYFIETPGLPLTANGKIDKKALPEPRTAEGSGYIPPRNPIQEQLARIWSEILALDKNRVSIDANFFEIGGHSLKATVLMSRIHKEMHIKVQLSEIFKAPTIRELSELFKKAERKRYINIKPVEKKEYYALSPGQKRLYLLHQMGAVYNMTAVWNLEGGLKKEELHETIRQLIRRHESLRTSFLMVGSVPVQKIHESKEVEFVPEYRDLTESGSDEIGMIKELTRHFDLSEPPLLKVGLIKTEPGKHILMIDMHHIVSDGTSLGMFAKEFSALYAGRSLEPLRLQYKEYSQWQVRESVGVNMKKQEEYWLRQFASEAPLLSLPYDYPRPGFQSFAGGTVDFSLSSEETGAVKRFAVTEDVTLYMALLAMFDVLLAKLSGNEDITVGSPIAGRRHVDLQSIIGMFVGTLAVRNHPSPGKTLTGFIKEVKECTLGAFENQDYPFENLVEKVVVNRDAGRNPLFDVMFALQNIDFPGIEMAGLKMTPYEYERGVAFFDLFMQCYEVQEGLIFVVNYCTELFKQETIERFIKYFKKILSLFVKNPRLRIAEIEIISDDEKREIVNDFNNTRTGYPADKTIYRLFEEQAERTPANIAAAGMSCRAAAGPLHISYRELHREAGSLTGVLLSKGIGPGTVAGIKVQPSLEMIIGIFAILKAGGAYLPIDPGYPPERIDYMLGDSAARLLLTIDDFASLASGGPTAWGSEEGPVGHLERTPGSGNSKVFDERHNSEIPSPGGVAVGRGGLGAGAASLAYIIYTSGSTGNPKGVMVENNSVVNILFALQDAYPMLPGDRYLLKTSFIFDVSVAELFGWIFNGSRLVIMGEEERKDPRKILDSIVSEKITHVNFVPSMFNAFLELLDRENTRKLTALRYIFLAGEALSPHLVKKFRELGSDVILENLYGPTEGTVYAGGYSLSHWDGTGSIPIGKPLPNMGLYILDKGGHLQPKGVPGELCIAGAGVARGYLNRPELTAKKIVNNKSFLGVQGAIFQKSPLVAEGKIIYETGDLACWLPDGNIEFLGRIDQQVKIRGNRVELGEIENRLLKHERITGAVVTAREAGDGSQYLCAYIMCRQGLDPVELREHISRTLPDYMVPSFFVQLEEIPLTVSGKVDRKSLPEPEVKSETAYTAPRDELEERLAEIWRRVLQVPSAVGIDDNFFALGGHSLKGAILTAKIHKEFNVRLVLTEIFNFPTIRKLSPRVKQSVKEIYRPIEPAKQEDYYTLSSAQKRLYVLHQVEQESIGYNMPMVYEISRETDTSRLPEIFDKMIARHESFRTSFHMRNEEPVQKIHDPEDIKFNIEYYEPTPPLRGTPPREGISHVAITGSFIRPFDLSKAPLLRVGLINRAGEKSLMLIDMHHIISDGASIEIFERELAACYEGKELPGLRTHYKNFAAWQNSDKRKEETRTRESYWLNRFLGDIPVLALPLDFPRPSVQSFTGNTISFEVGEKETALLDKLAKEEEVTLFIAISTLFYILLAKLSGQEDIVIGTPAAGRGHPDLEHIIGMFVNTLPLRCYPKGEKRYREFLREVKLCTLGAFENQDYQFEDLVERLKVSRDAGRNPVFDVMFALQDRGVRSRESTVFTLKPYPFEYNITKFDLMLIAEAGGDKTSFYLQYCTKLFKSESIDRYINYFRKIVTAVLADPAVYISDIEILTGQEKEEILTGFNDTGREYPRHKTIARLFEEQVERTPLNTALTGTDREAGIGKKSSYCYKELNEKANRLAHVLREKGVGADIPVALLLERSMHMIVGILAVLKAGGAYLPIEPGCPLPRMIYMLKDTGTRLLLSEAAFAEKTSPLGVEVLDIEDGGIYGNSIENPGIINDSADLAYIIYTSGTSGKPKATLTAHYNVIRVVKNTNYIEITEADRVLQLSNYAFDGSVFDIYGALLNGAALIMISREDVLAVDRLSEIIKQRQVTVFFVTTALFNALADIDISCFDNVRKVLFGGERVSLEHTKKAVEYLGKDRVIHVYGPTETTVYATYYFIEQVDEVLGTVPIGKPLANTTAYILDLYGKPVPVGVTGEIYIGGDGVARGYLNQPELTAKKFIASGGPPFCKKVGPKTFDEGSGAEFPSYGGVPRSGGVGLVPTSNFQLIYKTGDSARWLPGGPPAGGAAKATSGGLIEFVGRIDQQVKIRGFRIELGEIEARLLEIPGIKEAVVTVRGEEKGEKTLCAYIICLQEPNSGVGAGRAVPSGEPCDPTLSALPGSAELRESLSRTLPDYMIPSSFVFLDKIPLTPNGKVDRKALPEPEIAGETSYVAPRNEIETRLAEIWRRVLKTPSAVGIDDNFFDLGGHSLKATLLSAAIHKAFNIKVYLAIIFEFPTIRKLTRYIREAAGDKVSEIYPTEKKNCYNLSFNQKRLWFIYQREPQSPAFNMPDSIEFSQHVDAACLQEALLELCRRHESLRTGFTTAADEPVQFIVPRFATLPFSEIDISHLIKSKKKQELNRVFMEESRRVFDLTRVPLFRSLLVKLAHDHYVFMFVMHHIISDGWSLELFKNELSSIYECVRTGQPIDLKPLRLQYKDFSKWHNRFAAGEGASGKSHRFWKQKIEQGVPRLLLPANVDADSRDVKGALYRFPISPDLQEKLKILSRESNTTLFMVMFAPYLIALSRYSNQEDIACSIISAGREHESLHPVIGFFVNSILFTARVNPEEGFVEFLRRVSGEAMECFVHQNYPLEILFQEMKKRYPDIPVAFNMVNLPGDRESDFVEAYEPGHRSDSQDVKFDLEPYIFEYKNGIDTMWAYKKSMFSARTIEYFVRDYVKLLEFFTGYPEKSYRDFKAAGKKKKKTLTIK